MSEPDWELDPVELPFPVGSIDPSGPGGPLSGLPPGDRGFFVQPEAGVDQAPRWVSGQDIAQAQQDLMTIGSNLLNFVPVVGTYKGIVEGFTGKDLITGEEQAWWEGALTAATLIPEIEGAKGVFLIIETIGEAARAVDDLSDAKDIYDAATGGN